MEIVPSYFKNTNIPDLDYFSTGYVVKIYSRFSDKKHKIAFNRRKEERKNSGYFGLDVPYKDIWVDYDADAKFTSEDPIAPIINIMTNHNVTSGNHNCNITIADHPDIKFLEWSLPEINCFSINNIRIGVMDTITVELWRKGKKREERGSKYVVPLVEEDEIKSEVFRGFITSITRSQDPKSGSFITLNCLDHMHLTDFSLLKITRIHTMDFNSVTGFVAVIKILQYLNYILTGTNSGLFAELQRIGESLIKGIDKEWGKVFTEDLQKEFKRTALGPKNSSLFESGSFLGQGRGDTQPSLDFNDWELGRIYETLSNNPDIPKAILGDKGVADKIIKIIEESLNKFLEGTKEDYKRVKKLMEYDWRYVSLILSELTIFENFEANNRTAKSLLRMIARQTMREVFCEVCPTEGGVLIPPNRGILRYRIVPWMDDPEIIFDHSDIISQQFTETEQGVFTAAMVAGGEALGQLNMETIGQTVFDFITGRNIGVFAFPDYLDEQYYTRLGFRMKNVWDPKITKVIQSAFRGMIERDYSLREMFSGDETVIGDPRIKAGLTCSFIDSGKYWKNGKIKGDGIDGYMEGVSHSWTLGGIYKTRITLKYVRQKGKLFPPFEKNVQKVLDIESEEGSLQVSDNYIACRNIPGYYSSTIINDVDIEIFLGAYWKAISNWSPANIKVTYNCPLYGSERIGSFGMTVDQSKKYTGDKVPSRIINGDNNYNKIKEKIMDQNECIRIARLYTIDSINKLGKFGDMIPPYRNIVKNLAHCFFTGNRDNRDNIDDSIFCENVYKEYKTAIQIKKIDYKIPDIDRSIPDNNKVFTTNCNNQPSYYNIGADPYSESDFYNKYVKDIRNLKYVGESPGLINAKQRMEEICRRKGYSVEYIKTYEDVNYSMHGIGCAADFFIYIKTKTNLISWEESIQIALNSGFQWIWANPDAENRSYKKYIHASLYGL